MDHPSQIKISDFEYSLPAHRIAQFPLARRDESKLLIYNDGKVSTDIFKNIVQHLPAGARLIFNQTRVIPARIIMQKPTGARIEIFCLEPAGVVLDYQLAMQQGPGCEWKCLVGNARRWKSDVIESQIESGHEQLLLKIRKVRQEKDHYVIRFEWSPGSYTFSEILEIYGKIPLPPYIHREADENDRDRYQTVFAKEKGSIAAPTAGLHFTEEILAEMGQKNISTSAINLHVGAGTFKPVTSEELSGHSMHTEFISVNAAIIKDFIQAPDKKTILVGTTTVRTMESLYWQGAKWMQQKPDHLQMDIRQWDPYDLSIKDRPPLKEALEALLYYMDRHDQKILSGYTSLMIAPGYTYMVPDAIITNFHMPRSTLLLLVAAFIGDDWLKAYEYALEHDFRFLSYGDSCLFFKKSI